MSGTVADVLRIAESQVGYSRWDDPEQGTRYGRWYAEITGRPYYGTNGVHFCAMYTSWVLSMAGVQCEGFPRAAAIDRTDHLNRQVEPVDLMPGDPTGFDWHPNDDDFTADHVGIFKRWLVKGMTFECYEGNVNNGRVELMVRDIENVTIGVRPYYSGSESPKASAGLLDVDGICGPKTVTRMQVATKTPDDGVISNQRANEDWARPNVWAVEHSSSGHSDLVLAIQTKLKLMGLYHGTVDGLWGGETSKGIQRYLMRLGYYNDRIDGIFGQASVKALQECLNDGRFLEG